MTTLTKDHAAGGTEILVRPKPLDRRKPLTHFPAEDAPRACRLRQTVEDLRHALEISEPPETEELTQRLERALHQRLQFWMDTCSEVQEMKTPCREVLELHRLHGCRFWLPSSGQVQYLLNALDLALPGWDDRHPQLFYQTMELNFPELVRGYGARRRN